MIVGLVGRKCGMTQSYTEEGQVIPVTVVEVQPNRVTQIKDAVRDGYDAVQVTFGEKKYTSKRKRLSRAQLGHFRKAGVEPGFGLWEFEYLKREEGSASLALGSVLTLNDVFKVGEWVDVTGVTKGKGFSGVIKRHHFSSQDATHGNSLSHRAPGSIGQRQSPGRVFKGKKMAGQLGNKRRTIQSLKIISIDDERHLILIKGAIPGSPGGYVLVRHAVRKRVRA